MGKLIALALLVPGLFVTAKSLLLEDWLQRFNEWIDGMGDEDRARRDSEKT